MSIVRIGLSETKKFAQGYDAIFAKKGGGRKRTKSAKASTAKRKKKTKK